MTSPVFTARVPFTAPQIGAVYDPQQMRTAMNGITRAIPPMVTRTTTVDTKIAATDDTLLVDTTSGNITVTLLPANQVQFLRVQIKNIGTGSVTIIGTIDGTTALGIAPLATLVVQSDGVAWRRLNLPNDRIWNALDYGVRGDSISDDATAINALVLRVLAVGGGTIYFGAAIYYFNSNLLFSITGSVPKGLLILCDPEAVFVPGSAVTVAITLATATDSDGITSRLTWQGGRVEGLNTTGATGFLVGQNAGNLSSRITCTEVEVFRFTGVGGKGLSVHNVTGAYFHNCYFGRSYENVYIAGTDLALPTFITFFQCRIREATTHGVNVVIGYNVSLLACLIESNGAEGVYCVPGAGNNVTSLVIDTCWFENSYAGSGAQATNYHLKADGTSTTVSLSVRNTRFAGTSLSVALDRVVNTVLDNIYCVGNHVGDVAIGANCRGVILNWPINNVTFSTAVTNASPTRFYSIQVSWQEKVYVDSSGNLLPTGTNLYDFGNTTFRWKDIWLAGSVQSAQIFTSGTINPGDAIVGNTSATKGIYVQPGDATGHGALRSAGGVEMMHWDGAGTAVTFDTSPTSNAYKVASTQVVGAQRTGWNAPTTGGGALLRGTFDTGATLVQTAETLAAVITDLRAHGLLGT